MWSYHTHHRRCGCCGFTEGHVQTLKSKQGAAGGPCPPAAVGPFPFAGGMLYGVTRSAVESVRAKLSSMLEVLQTQRRATELTWSEDNTIGYVLHDAPGVAAVSLCKNDACMHDYDAHNGMRRYFNRNRQCFLRLGLSPQNFTTGHRSRWNVSEVLTPSSVVAHHITSRAAFERVLRLRRSFDQHVPDVPCLVLPPRVVKNGSSLRHLSTRDTGQTMI